MKRSYLFVLGVAAIIIGIIGLSVLQMYPFFSRTSSREILRGTFSSIGERIYFTAVGKNGPIPFRSGPYWLRMHGGSCASCHGSDGQGGLPIMMSNKEAPAITYKSLTEKEEFTERLIKRAITQGLDEEGKPLDITMPRWDMLDEDLDVLIDFLKTLD